MLYQNKSIITVWRIIIIVSTSYISLFLPLNIIYDLEFKDLLHSIRILISIVFFGDVALNFFRYKGLYKDKNFREIHGAGSIHIMLILVDFIAATFLIVDSDAVLFQLVPILKMFRVYKIFYDARLKHIQFTNFLVFIFFIFWIIHIVHWLSCGWSLIKNQDPTESILTSYINSLYWTITTITTVGYGDILPQNNIQKLYSMFVMVMGFGVFGLLVGTIASAILKKNPARMKYHENLENLASFMHFRKIPGKLQKRILDYYTYIWKKRIGYDESSFLESLPESLRSEVAVHIKREVIKQVSLFRETSKAFKQEIAVLLKPIFLTPDDYVFKTGDPGNEIYFIVNGDLNILNQCEDKIIATLKPGDYFGEIALYRNINRTATVKAVSYCDIYVLNKEAFNHVISKYPDLEERIKQIVEKRATTNDNDS